MTPQGQAIIVLFDTVTNAVVGYDKLLLRNLKFNRMNPFQMRLSASAGVLELDVDIKPIGQTEERLTHGFESQIQTFSLYCPACLRAIQPHAVFFFLFLLFLFLFSSFTFLTTNLFFFCIFLYFLFSVDSTFFKKIASTTLQNMWVGGAQ